MKKIFSHLLLGNIVYKVSINTPFEKVFQTLSKAISNNDFSVVAVHDLKNTFIKANLDIPLDFEYRIVQLCNAKKAHKVITEMSYDMGIMMPKSIIIAFENGETTLRFMQMKSWMIGMMFPSVDIVPMSKRVMATMKKIIDEVVLESGK
ncbi:DUF302 domain-containing protein [Candidatus Gracilibacteria bacterium]|nr:DUF302 domain-containing protein [Candidatus Gracilibacteria bacterium]